LNSLEKCRVCSGVQLEEVLNLGVQPLSGVFPSNLAQPLTSGPLRLVHCGQCELIQLGESFSHSEMYGENYGYKSNLNPSMVNHLQSIANGLIRKLNLDSSSIICDIGSNDGTFLSCFTELNATLIGIDPTIVKYSKLYNASINVSSSFFSTESFSKCSDSRATLITSIAMFYDLENPVQFARDINECLSEDGYWFFEQSYAPWMLSSGAYDTICHEHLEYYSLKTITNILSLAGFGICDVSTNSVNGGSISILAKKGLGLGNSSEYGRWLLKQEEIHSVNKLENWLSFGEKVRARKESLNDLIYQIINADKTVYALGASTKGNVLLNYSGISVSQIPSIGEVNDEKWGKYTPGSRIPIVNEEDVFKQNPDYLLFLPWHFRDFAVNKYSTFLQNGGKLIFPLPTVEVIGY
jgi:hypothetical protein